MLSLICSRISLRIGVIFLFDCFWWWGFRPSALKTPAIRARDGLFMNNDKSVQVAKAQALGAMAFLVNNGFNRCVLDVSNLEVVLSVYCLSVAELVASRSMLKPFFSDGCTIGEHHLEDSDCYVISIEWPFPYYNGY